ncbi:unnamed protein product [Leuciscus chuanchicus]
MAGWMDDSGSVWTPADERRPRRSLQNSVRQTSLSSNTSYSHACPFPSSLRPPLHELCFICVSPRVPWERLEWRTIERERRDLAPDILHEIIVKQRPDRITGRIFIYLTHPLMWRERGKAGPEEGEDSEALR